MESVACVGGPLDGGEIDTVPGAPELEVTMADGTRHSYARREPTPTDRRPVFEWRGRR